MVNPIGLALIGIAGVGFVAAGGISKSREFLSSFKEESAEDRGTSTPVDTPSSKTERLDKKFSSKPEDIRTITKVKGITTDVARGQERKVLRKSKGSAQFSTGQIGTLTKEQIDRLRSAKLSTQEIRDLEKLTARNKRKRNRGLSSEDGQIRDPLETIFLKRGQEQLSKNLITSRFGGQSFVKGKLFANPDFGAPSKTGENLTRAERDEIKKNIVLNRINAERQEKLGQKTLADINKSGKSVFDFLRDKGIKLNSSDISGRALARLSDRGLI